MQLRDYIRIFVRRAWIIALAVAITATSALVVSNLQTPVYRSTIYVNAIPARLDWGLQQVIRGHMRNFARTIQSRQHATQVINRLQLDITPDQLREKITVSPIESDFLIRIDADDYDPLLARDIVQTTAEIFVENTRVQMLDQDKQDRVEVSILDYSVPGGLHRPQRRINVLAGGLFGVLAGVVVILFLEWLEADIIRTSTDMERHSGVAVLGVLPNTTALPRPTRERRRREQPSAA
jgi:capsular polysaccharide biosynthesis protein